MSWEMIKRIVYVKKYIAWRTLASSESTHFIYLSRYTTPGLHGTTKAIRTCKDQAWAEFFSKKSSATAKSQPQILPKLDGPAKSNQKVLFWTENSNSYFRRSGRYCSLIFSAFTAKLSWFRTSLQNLAASANFAENFGGMRLHQMWT